MTEELNKDWNYWYTQAMSERVQRVELQRKIVQMCNAEVTTITGTVYTIDSIDDAPNVDDENTDIDVIGTLRELKGKRVQIQITTLS